MKLDSLNGRWSNSKEDTVGIKEFTISIKEEKMELQIIGVDNGPLAGSWGTYTVSSYGTLERPDQFSGFQLTVTIQNIEVVLAGNINKGLIIIALYGAPESEQGLSNFFIREFFYQTN